MPRHYEAQIFPYTADQVYDLVADISRYPEFLPWCTALRIRKQEGNVLIADMSIGFKLIRETFTTRVSLDPENYEINVAYINGPFKYLANRWHFSALEGGRCEVTFDIDFEFRSKLLQTLMGTVFNEVISRMVRAFKDRAEHLYGSPSGAASS